MDCIAKLKKREHTYIMPKQAAKKIASSRAKKSSSSSQMISLRLPATAVAELDEICDRSGNTRGSLIQLAVAEWLDRRKRLSSQAEG